MPFDDSKYAFYHSKLPIDRYNLDEALIEQHILYLQLSDLMVDASYRRDQAKEQLTRIDARLYEQIAGTLEKPTDAKVMNKLVQHPEHIEASAELLSEKLVYDRWAGMFEAYRQRASMLKYLTELIAAGYYSTPSRGETTTLDEARAPRTRRRVVTD